MFERFTEKAVNAVSESQKLAAELQSPEVCPEHLLLALVREAKGVSLKLFRMYGITGDNMNTEVAKYARRTSKKLENIPFSHSYKDLLKHTLDLASRSGNSNILFEHLFLTVIIMFVDYKISLIIFTLFVIEILIHIKIRKITKSKTGNKPIKIDEFPLGFYLGASNIITIFTISIINLFI